MIPVLFDSRYGGRVLQRQQTRSVRAPLSAELRPRVGLLLNAESAAFHLKALHPRQSGWSQWHASAVTFFESWQIWLQYFCLSGAIQLQAGCAHFFVPAIPILLTVKASPL
jgi:hypothetical protein